MTLEEALAKIKTLEEERAALEEEHDAALTAKDAEIGKLKTKNGELIAEKRQLQKTKREPDDETAEAMRKRIEAEYSEQMKALEKSVADLRNERDGAIIGTELSSALDRASVSVALRPAAVALIKTSRKLEVTGGKLTIDGKPAASAIEEWAKSDEGKPFVSVPPNGGSAAPGASGAQPPVSKTRSQMSPGDKGAYIREHGIEAYNRLPR